METPFTIVRDVENGNDSKSARSAEPGFAISARSGAMEVLLRKYPVLQSGMTHSVSPWMTFEELMRTPYYPTIFTEYEDCPWTLCIQWNYTVGLILFRVISPATRTQPEHHDP